MTFDDIQKTFKTHKRFIVATHVNPDPDALSSQLALAFYLKAIGKKVAVLAEEPIPCRFDFMPGSAQIKSLVPGRKVDYDAAVVVDCGDLGRIGKVRGALDPSKPVINIDHHVTNDCFGTVNCVLPGASSTAEIIFDFLERVHFPLTKKIAALLYLGIMTDTGSFRFENTTSRTHAVISKLLAFDLPVNGYYQKIYETVPLADLQNFAKLVAGFHSCFDGKVIYLELPRRKLSKFSEEFDLRDKIFGYLRSIKGVEVLMILTEQGKHKTRVNFRSQGRVDVSRLAAEFEGGGHSRASGCFVPGSMSDAADILLKRLEQLLTGKP